MATHPGSRPTANVSDQYAPFATQVIPATVSEAPYILDGLLMTDAGRRIRLHFSDTGGFTDHVFATCAGLGFQFSPRIRDLPSKRLYAFNPAAAPDNVRPLIGGKVNEAIIVRNWPDIRGPSQPWPQASSPRARSCVTGVLSPPA